MFMEGQYVASCVRSLFPVQAPSCRGMLRSLVPCCASVSRTWKFLSLQRAECASKAGKVTGSSQEKPVEPSPEDCCQSGCRRCVWEIYLDDLAKWEKDNPLCRTASSSTGYHEHGMSSNQVHLVTVHLDTSMLPLLREDDVGVTTSKGLTELDPLAALELRLKQKDKKT